MSRIFPMSILLKVIRNENCRLVFAVCIALIFCVSVIKLCVLDRVGFNVIPVVNSAYRSYGDLSGHYLLRIPSAISELLLEAGYNYA